MPAVGSSVFYTMSRLVDHPKAQKGGPPPPQLLLSPSPNVSLSVFQEIFSLLASTLPYSTHFYLSYFPLQWTFQAA